jgi:hypothetical protein
VRNALSGTEAVETRTATDGSESRAYVRNPDGYWFTSDHWGHGRVTTMGVENLRPAFIRP